jgi:hypothetical protein
MFTNILSNLHLIVILIVYTDEKSRRKTDMKTRLNEDYYFWCCDWCDSENLVPWTKLLEGANCGACHRPMNLSEPQGIDATLSAGLC